MMLGQRCVCVFITCEYVCVLSSEWRKSNIKGLNVGHGQCRKSDVKIKHPIKLSQPAKCNNRTAGTGLSIRGLPHGPTEDSDTALIMWQARQN